MVARNSTTSYQGTLSSAAVVPPGKMRNVKGSINRMRR